MKPGFVALLVIAILVVAAAVAWFTTVALSSHTLKNKFSAHSRKHANQTQPTQAGQQQQHHQCDQVSQPDETKLLVVGLAKNIAHNVANIEQLVLKLKTVFPNSEVYIGENGSTDGTLAKLQQHAGKLWTIIDLSHLPHEADRIDRMAALRNELQAQVFHKRSHIEEKDEAVMCVLDFDIPYVWTAVDKWPIAVQLLKHDQTIAAVTGIGLVQHKLFPKPYFYDTYAYRERKGDTCKSGTAKNWLKMALKYGTQCEVVERVGNNFGGVAMYRAEQVRGIKYISRDKQNKTVCEHVTFQDQIQGDVVVCGALVHLS